METVTLMLIAFIAIMAGLMISALRNRIIVTLAFRNFLRNKGSTITVVMGLMVGTAIIMSSMAISDSFETVIAADVIDEYGGTDLYYGFQVEGSREEVEFPESVYDDMQAGLAGSDSIDGIAPELRKVLGVMNVNEGLVEPRASVSGFIFKDMNALGRFFVDGNPVSELPEGTVLVSEELARNVGAGPGDTLSLLFVNRTGNFTVEGVLDAEERGLKSIMIWINLYELQELLGIPDTINEVHVSAQGDVLGGMDQVEEVKREVEALGITHEGLPLKVLGDKKELYDAVFEEGFFLGDLLLVFGSFTIIAGVILIINIFVMLGEERRSEMGMSRAVGMNRKDLQRLFLYEGSIYGVLAALVGTVLGVAIAYVLLLGIGSAFDFEGGGTDIVRAFTVQPESWVMSFIGGFLITIATIFYATRKIGNLDIIRAIRNLPEPVPSQKDTRSFRIGLMLLGLGLLVTVFALYPLFDGSDNNANGMVDDAAEGSATTILVGLTMVFFGLPLLLRRVISDRLSFSVGAILVIAVWSVLLTLAGDLEIDFFTFTFAGIFLVAGTVILLMANSTYVVNAFEGLLALAGRGRAVTRTAMKYSLSSGFRTGLTIAMFSLVIFIITFMSVLLAVVGENVDTQLEESSGGFDILMKMVEPADDFEVLFQSSESADRVEAYYPMVTTQVTVNKYSLILDTDMVPYPVVGINDEFIANNGFSISEMLPEFGGDEEMLYDAIREDGNYAIADSGTAGAGFGPPPILPLELGETQEVVLADGSTRSIRVVAYMDTYQSLSDFSMSLNGIFLYEPYVVNEYDASGVGVALLNLRDEGDSLTVRQDMERTFLPYGAQTVDFQEESAEQFRSVLEVFNLLNAYLGLGLVVGIAGLGIITARSVSERQTQIGMMRAVGYNRRQVLASFLIESSYISLLGILIGVVLGLVTSVILYLQLFEGSSLDGLIIPGASIAIIILISLGATFLSIVPPARRASMVAPAEVLRYE
ncbi:MAG: FtsX-like permease family protein [Thermoplasmata archaeon]|nr:MAG: FtsX-like permease family protein [Thermoplasmata archaeon]